MADKEHSDGAEENGGAGQACLVLLQHNNENKLTGISLNWVYLILMFVIGFKHLGCLLGSSKASPDDPVKYGKD